MRDFKRSSNFGNRDRSFGPKREFGNRGPRPTLFKTQCSKCGKECEVPFKPTGDRPVFCRDCFRENGGNENRRPDERNFSRPAFQNTQSAPADTNVKEQLTILNEKLDKVLHMLAAAAILKEQVHEIPEEPVSEEKPVSKEKKKRTSKKALLS